MGTRASESYLRQIVIFNSLFHFPVSIAPMTTLTFESIMDNMTEIQEPVNPPLTMGKIDIPTFRANESRLAKAIHDSCEFGAAHR